MAALDIWNGIKPPYASGLLFELHEATPAQYSIQVYYKNNTLDDHLGEAVPMTLPGVLQYNLHVLHLLCVLSF